MKRARDVLSSLQQRRVELRVENGSLRFHAPKGVLRPEDLDDLRALKSELIELLEQTKVPASVRLQPRIPGCLVPLTATQLAARGESGVSTRHSSFAVRVEGPLNISLLRNSLGALAQRHEALRTRIVTIDGIPRQHIDKKWEYELEVVDLSGSHPISTETEAGRFVQRLASGSFDLAVGPLFLPKLLKLSDHLHVLSVGLDHMITDGVSNDIINAETWTLYNRGLQGLPLSLPDLRLQFADYAVWHQRSYAEWRKSHEGFWRDRLTGAPRTQIPIDAGLPEAESPSVATLDIQFGETLSAKLRQIAGRGRTLLSLVVLAIYAVVMSRWCGQKDMVIACATNGRFHSGLEGMVGYIAHNLYLRIDLVKEDTFLDVMGRITHEFNRAYHHDDFGRVHELIPECRTELIFNWTPFYGVRGSVDHLWDAASEIRVQPFPFPPAWCCKFLSFFSDTAMGVAGQVVYRPDLFRAGSIERFGQLLLTFADEFARCPSSRVLSISSDGEMSDAVRNSQARYG